MTEIYAIMEAADSGGYLISAYTDLSLATYRCENLNMREKKEYVESLLNMGYTTKDAEDYARYRKQFYIESVHLND